MASWAARYGAGRVAIEALGRWKSGTTNSYILSAKKNVVDTQLLVAKKIREHAEDGDIFGEGVVFEGVVKRLLAVGVTETVAQTEVGKIHLFGLVGSVATDAQKLLQELDKWERDQEVAERELCRRLHYCPRTRPVPARVGAVRQTSGHRLLRVQ